MKLSIIISYYNLEKYIGELLDILVLQLTNETECIVVDDGSTVPFKTEYNCIQVYRKENGGCASARNLGINKSSGEYITFIDADDLVAEYYIEKLIDKINTEHPDIIDLSWKSLSFTEGAQYNYLLRKNSDRLSNPSVCTRCFKRSFIGHNRFNEYKDSTEDEDFSRKLGILDLNSIYKHAAICEYMYYYRTAVTDSKIKRYKAGLMKTKRIVYYYNHVTANMINLVEEIKEEDKYNEVFLLTNQCDIPELKRYCQIRKPCNIWTHYLRGEPYNGCEKIEIPIKTQIVIYCEYMNRVGGIGTFIYNWCLLMRDYYDIIFVYKDISQPQINRISKIVKCECESSNKKIFCDTIILNRITDQIPLNITYKRVIQIAHCCFIENKNLPVKDINVFVSNTSRDSWLRDRPDIVFNKTAVIHNPLILNNDDCDEEILKEIKEAKAAGNLIIVSATRIGAPDKGLNDARFIKLANMLNEINMSFKWFNFSDNGIYDGLKNFINKPYVLNCQPIIAEADYLVQLSDKEAYSYAILEALALGTPVLSTPFDSLFEQGFVDRSTGYIIPFNMELDFNIMDILYPPKFEYHVHNDKIAEQWRNLLGEIKSIAKSETPYIRPKFFKVKIENEYYDKAIGKTVFPGETYEMDYERTMYLLSNFSSLISIINK